MFHLNHGLCVAYACTAFQRCVTCFMKIRAKRTPSLLSDQLYFISDLVNTQVMKATNYDANNRACIHNNYTTA